ncbi:ERCC4 domain-containing protein [Microbulbifer rhizosphaerae]|uniref:ERCC4-type nuclease n=1 Tax=Microbulbifer rhizosphaerae TaxID=1562603 RepID=A0A7W4ZB21_9GAMM|nr:ERCC4 domain-containing protein [Microbulbifer rhizosphaerae]MBB3061964.1 ERCC4-type nuclease [Microbulbifer rhizosphaerae]
MLITVDHREQSPALLDELRRQNICIERAPLPLGDYRVGDQLLFERKTATDLRLSLADGRLFDQARRLYHWRAQQPDRRVALIVEGRVQPPGAGQRERRILQGALVKIALLWDIPLLRTLLPEESARVMLYAARQHERGKLQAPLPALSCPNETLGTRAGDKHLVQRRLLQSLPGIGPRRARALLARFGSIAAIMNAEESELATVENLGRELARRIRWLVSEAPGIYRVTKRKGENQRASSRPNRSCGAAHRAS